MKVCMEVNVKELNYMQVRIITFALRHSTTVQKRANQVDQFTQEAPSI